MISYEAAPGAKVFVKGSEVLKDGWQQESIPVGFRRRRSPSRPGSKPKSAHGSTHSPARCSPMPTTPSPWPASPGDRAWLDHQNRSTWVRISAAADWSSWTASRWSRWSSFANWRCAHLQPAPRLYDSSRAANRPAPSPPRRTDYAGNWRLAGCPVLGGKLGKRHSHPPGLGNARRPPHRSHHPRTGLRPLAKGLGLHPDQGNHLSARRQRLPVSAVRHGLHPPAAITGSSKATPSNGPTVSASTSARRRRQRSRAASRGIADPPRQHLPLLRRRRPSAAWEPEYAHRR